MKSKHSTFLFAAALLILPIGSTEATEPIYEGAPIHYREREADNHVTRLFADPEKVAAIFARATDSEILRRVLVELKVPIESQVLVFSKTSAQNSRISPETPRAIYYSDDIYVGWVQGGDIELASFDRQIGLVFHKVTLSGRIGGETPQLVRSRSCLNCHAGSSNRDLPGLMIRSVVPLSSGQPLFGEGTFHTRHDSAVEERWGGWYVTGSVEGTSHMGNRFARPREAANDASPLEFTEITADDTTSLEGLFETEPYLQGGSSDLVALMLLEHQVGVHNALVRANLTTQITLHRHREMQKAFGESIDTALSDSADRVLDHLADDVLEALLFVDEYALPGDVSGSSEFTKAFEGGRLKSRSGRSLRDLRLYERLMKYRCSYLIYSEAFEGLPDPIRTRILEKLYQILAHPASHPAYSRLGGSERRKILEIISGTVPRLPSIWDEPVEEAARTREQNREKICHSLPSQLPTI